MTEVVDTVQADDSGISKKGLTEGSVGVLGAVVIGLSCCAPAYTLTAALGPAASEVGTQLPAIFIVGFIPMFLVAMGYRALNKAMPDSGTSFTWATRAFGPWIGWMGGWGLIAATVLVLSNLAGIAVEFLYLALSQIFQNPEIADWGKIVWVNILTCLSFMAIATWISYRGMTSTKAFQYVIVAFQMLILVWFIVAAFTGAYGGSNPDSIPVQLSWFNPFEVSSFSAFSAGIAVSIFVYWGWDTVLTMNEETKESKGKSSTSGKAATILIFLLVGFYVAIGTATVAFAGVGDGATGLGNADIADNVFAALAHPVMGSAGILLALAVLASSAASLQSTAVSPARTLLAMGHYKALPAKYATISPRYTSPSYAIFVSAIVASAFYAVMRVVSENVLWDTITALGMMVCFYYGITAFACVWYFRREAFTSAKAFFLKILMPGLGGIFLFITFIQTAIDSMDPEFGSGSAITFGSGPDAYQLGLVFVLGVGVLLLGVVVMFIMRWRYPAFFRGEILKQGTPLLTIDE
ncbi:APC family permease [Klugiella xanthotipulae]|uniref:Amino acid/polyamine/organocation transporter (APC superfamily) n=1 Tax=Klugiella xanthotipulae TaxID=244735 RepID=A0A543HXL5_9MICO|nr:APC family permease [Klugiella xanthotipulae]TQM63051.1 amino acid/polyamine/organocation transporter (APC superfamily) [Klugiella xanthotipulae]